MSSAIDMTGGCVCGSVRYVYSGEPVAMFNCYCRCCQRSSGTGHAPTVAVRKKWFRIVEGDPINYSETLANGETASRSFCGICGGQLFGATSSRPELVMLRVGSLDDSDWFRAAAGFWVSRARPWDQTANGLSTFPENPSNSAK